MGWMLVAAVVVSAALFGGWVIAKGRQPAPPAPFEVDELLADADAVRAAAGRAVVAADEARDRAESAEQASSEAEQRYLASQWETRAEPEDEANRLVQKAALDAYQRGDLSVTQLNNIWEQSGAPEWEPKNVDAAREEYDRALAETAQVRHEAHVAEVAAEVLAEETRIVEHDVRMARQEARPGLEGLLRAGD
ncbi:hypothetical protein FB565_003883 [Actinoplanes lutulentus]|uniref:Uncharacterized protein n=1 Tax=Actinoplanes lutulentus TaxID=1287878 RepID=A0A327ZIZ4_9ACTN|nr:hypothetical protein [Actinoplanes lutulentus]MBB2944154.1 hypothetical protein [Actinoplanes lutulentus]RAK42613.1 hypothetical protein B0I29_102438 [Actinoplanes lutulentus]